MVCGVVCVKIMTRLLSAVIVLLVVRLVMMMIGWFVLCLFVVAGLRNERTPTRALP